MNAKPERRPRPAPRGSVATIHVPLDGSEASALALPVAAAIAAAAGGTVHVVHVAGAEIPRQDILRRLRLKAADIRGRVVDQLVGRPAEAIIQTAVEERSGLIVMTTHGETAGDADGISPVTRDVLLGAPCPVVLVRPEIGVATLSRFAVRRVLLPHDGTPATAAAISPALELAESSGASVDVLHIAALGQTEPPARRTLTTPRYLDQPQHEWPAWSREFRDRLCESLGCCPTVPLRVSLGHGDPGTEIVRAAWRHRSSLIVLAWRGHLEEQRATTVKQVLRDSPCPVMLVRA